MLEANRPSRLTGDRLRLEHLTRNQPWLYGSIHSIVASRSMERSNEATRATPVLSALATVAVIIAAGCAS
jgi:hypothetical protein